MSMPTDPRLGQPVVARCGHGVCVHSLSGCERRSSMRTTCATPNRSTAASRTPGMRRGRSRGRRPGGRRREPSGQGRWGRDRQARTRHSPAAGLSAVERLMHTPEQDVSNTSRTWTSSAPRSRSELGVGDGRSGGGVESVLLERPRAPLAIFPAPIPPSVGRFHLRVPDDVATILGASEAHRRGERGAGVTVAMVDSGWFRHPFFAAHRYEVDPPVTVGPGHESGARPAWPRDRRVGERLRDRARRGCCGPSGSPTTGATSWARWRGSCARRRADRTS